MTERPDRVDPGTLPGDAAGAAPLPAALAMSLTGSHLIEASAGSGKTFTLVALFVRLILERDLKVDQILVVTFTRAATAELRQRIRRRLIECKEALQSGTSDIATQRLIAGDRGIVKLRLTAAIAMIDSAPIYTIHGFAQRALADRAFSAGTPFELELGETRPVWAALVKDFWRKRILHHDANGPISALSHRAMVEHLIKSDSPKSWVEWLLSHRTAAHARIARAERHRLIPVEDLLQSHEQLGIAWRDQRDEVESLLVKHPSLNHRIYSSRHVASHARKIDAYFSGPPKLVADKSLIRLSYSDMLTHQNDSGIKPPAHPLMLLIDAYLDLLGAYQNGIITWRQDLLIECFTQVPRQVAKRLAVERRLGYDDLLVQLDGLLQGERGESLARALRERYPAALIDEFQDTDALQDRIFAAIYRGGGDTALFLVGDPKQAIYRFRGADVFTYLGAAARVDARHSLEENFRSSDALIAAVNALYAGSADAFSHRDIAYQPVSAGRLLAEPLSGDEASTLAPLYFLLEDPESEKAKGELGQSAAAAIAAEIARMLVLADEGKLKIGDRRLVAGDIAVLVNRNDQGGLVRHALKELGIGAADHSRGSVFGGEEADWLLQLLLALFELHRPDRILNALATPIFGLDAQMLAQLSEDEVLWQDRLESFERYREAWQRSGVMRLWRMLLSDARHDAGMLGAANAERHLTNLFHLVELMHSANHLAVGLQGQIRWLTERIKLGAEDPEEGELRLESDDNLVQVMTVHKSKGLEFPVVFVPFMYAGMPATKGREARFGDMPVAFHDLEANAELVIDFGGPCYAEALEYEKAERAAEDARLLYVALTRAVHRCVVFWGHSSYGEPSALSRLIEPRLSIGAKLSHAVISERLAELAKTSSGRIGHRLAPLTAAQRSVVEPVAPLGMPRILSGKLPEPWRISSFTGLLERRLAKRLEVAAMDPEAVTDASEQPDHDQDVEPPIRQVESTRASALRYGFSRGAAAGECLHDILEHLQFDLSVDEQRTEVTRLLRAHGFDGRQSQEVCEWLQQVLSTPLAAGAPALAELSAAEQVREMEFHLPLFGAPIGELSEIAKRHGVVLPRFADAQVDGFLKGFIDLVFRFEARYFLVDYKSNWLGSRAADYRGLDLEEAMQAGGYHLQYLLYCVALVRWLRWRDPDFSYEQHFGGVFYLFLRGVGDPDANTLSDAGIYRVRPPEALIDQLDALLNGQRH